MGPRQPLAEGLITPEDVARMIGMSVDWVYDRAAAGDLPSYRLGGRIKFLPSEVWEALQAYRQGPPRPAGSGE